MGSETDKSLSNGSGHFTDTTGCLLGPDRLKFNFNIYIEYFLQ